MINFKVKYAPQTLDEVVFPTAEAKQIITDAANLTSSGHIILHGPYGTGKTTAAKLIAKTALGYVEGVDAIRFDADQNSSTDNIRSLKSFVARYSFGDQIVKFVLIDEVNGLTPKAQEALRGILDFSDECNTYFIMTTNHIEKIDGGIISRSECIKFDNSTPKLWLARAKYICEQEGVSINDDNDLLNVIATYGADTRKLMRKLESVVRQAKLSSCKRR